MIQKLVCIPEFVADKVHSQKDLWKIDICNISGFYMQYADTGGTLWFPFENECLDEQHVSEWNMQLSQDVNTVDLGLVIIKGKWSLAQNYDAVDDTYEKSISLQRHIYSLINTSHLQK